jgi:ABC-type Fe3+-hydroxamate transport system substrate-binding protein/diphthamide synthase (EF-2-diphthine--ammonia ligase)
MSSLRIACLIPSATDICVALGLTDKIVGVTHECQLSTTTARVLTTDELANLSQSEIHDRVQANSEQAVCALNSDIPSLYPILVDAFQDAAPSLVITQDLCNVCAPSTQSVQAILQQTTTNNIKKPTIVSLTPHTLSDVAENIRTVASACGIQENGERVAAEFEQHLLQIQQTVVLNRSTTKPPKMFLLEWLEPPFDGGHWIPEMMVLAGCQPARPMTDTRKSQQLEWNTIYASQPDIVVVACCGFDLQRNFKDARSARHRLERLSGSKIFATNGDLYFARPGPHLVVGCLIMAMCAYQKDAKVIQALLQLPYASQAQEGMQQLDMICSAATSSDLAVPDMEDFFALHKEACESGDDFYADPATGYKVFTEVAHKKRGKCCGSGCRHCPYSHENVKPENRAKTMQQPSMIYSGDDASIFALKNGNTRVLFFSGGKGTYTHVITLKADGRNAFLIRLYSPTQITADSFLTLRTQANEATKESFGLVLLTTFDATSRVIAHQDISIDVVEKQARHLGVALVGVPMHRGSSETYVERVRKGLEVVENYSVGPLKALVFGDLHLEHIWQWRKDMLGPLGYELVFPLFKTDYAALSADLEQSGISCVVSSSTVANVSPGEVFDENFRTKLSVIDQTIDLFGENGEFHTEAQVWTVDRATALGVRLLPE